MIDKNLSGIVGSTCSVMAILVHFHQLHFNLMKSINGVCNREDLYIRSTTVTSELMLPSPSTSSPRTLYGILQRHKYTISPLVASAISRQQ